MKELDKTFEYRSVIELEGTAANYIRVPNNIIFDERLTSKRVGIFSYLAIYKGLNNKLCLSIPKILEWANKKSDSHKGGINDKVLDTLLDLNNRGYFYFCDENTLTRTSCVEIEMNPKMIYEECQNGFAMLYIDEIERIMNYKINNQKDSYLNCFSILLVFSFLRAKIFRTPNKLKPEERSPEGIESRKKRCIEAYAKTYKEIGEYLDISERIVSKAVNILVELNLIVTAEAYHIKNEKDEYRTPYTIFTNYEKREGKYLLTYGKEYAINEINKMVNRIQKSQSKYNIKNINHMPNYLYNM